MVSRSNASVTSFTPSLYWLADNHCFAHFIKYSVEIILSNPGSIPGGLSGTEAVRDLYPMRLSETKFYYALAVCSSYLPPSLLCGRSFERHRTMVMAGIASM